MFLRVLSILFFALLAAVLFGLGFALYEGRDLSPEALEARYTDETSRFVTVDDVRFHVREAGTRTPERPSLVMIHGFGAHLQTWDVWSDALSSEYHVVRFDLPGHGLTGPDPEGIYTNARTLERITALIDALELERIVLIGNSLGGLMAWRYAAEQPAEAVAGLVLLAPGGLPLPGTNEDGRGEVPGWFGVIKYIFPRSVVKATLTNLYGDPERLAPETVDRYHNLLRRTGNRAALLARLGSFELSDPEAALRSIEARTLLMWGQEDGLLPVKQSVRFESWLPKVTVLRLPGVGHMPMEEIPNRSVSSAKVFLSSLPAPSRPIPPATVPAPAKTGEEDEPSPTR